MCICPVRDKGARRLYGKVYAQGRILYWSLKIPITNHFICEFSPQLMNLLMNLRKLLGKARQLTLTDSLSMMRCGQEMRKKKNLTVGKLT